MLRRIRSTLLFSLLALSNAVYAQPEPAPEEEAQSSAEEDPDQADSDQNAADDSAAERRRGRSRPRRRVPSPQEAFDNPHGQRSAVPRVSRAPDLRRGEVEVRLVATDTELLENRKVSLLVTKKSIAVGDTFTQVDVQTDMRGLARFSGQETETDFVYQVEARDGDAIYRTRQFQFSPAGGGIRVAVPVFPVTRQLGGLTVLSRGALVLQPQDQHFVVDLFWRFENYSQKSWVPQDIVFPLPPSGKALTAEPNPDGTGFERSDEGAALVGTYPPGRHDLHFRYHLPTDGASSVSLDFPTLNLNLGSFRVVLDSAPTMSLDVKGYPEPQERRNAKGQRQLIVGRDYVSESVRPPDTLHIRVAGIPTPPRGKMVAVLLALVLGGLGLVEALKRRDSAREGRARLTETDLQRATDLILSELVALEKAHEGGQVGRKMHERTKRQLLEAYARLGAERSGRAA